MRPSQLLKTRLSMAGTFPKKRPQGRDIEDKGIGIQKLHHLAICLTCLGSQLKNKRFRGVRAPLEVGESGRLGI